MIRTHIRLKIGEGIPQTYTIREANPSVIWSCSYVSFQYEEGQGIKIDVYAEDKEKMGKIIKHFIAPLLCTLPKYYYYGKSWTGSFDGLINGDFKEVGTFIVNK